MYISGMDVLYDYATKKENHDYLEQMGCNIEELIKLDNQNDIAEYIHNLEIIWQAIEQRYQILKIDINIDEIMTKIVKLFCFYILIGQYDGFPQNWELDESKQGITLAPFYDGSASFGKCCFDPRQSLAVSFEDKGINNYRILEEFFKISEQRYYDEFMKLYNKFTLVEFMKILKKVETKINKRIPQMTRKRIIDAFKFNKEEIEKMIERSINNGRR